MAGNSIPLILCGKFPTHRKAVTEALKPEFEVVRACSTNDEVKQAIKDYFVDNAQPTPQAIIMGGGFSQADFEELAYANPAVTPAQDQSSTSNGESQVAWFRPAHFAPGASGRPPFDGPPSVEFVVNASHKALHEHIDALRNGEGKGKMYYY